ncbi:Uncharacterized metal-binding protein YceD, DUF177 family [Kaistia soli DSM 19436]|uniref:Uncharacterized metal-binding protein YceD, DUF177 family n=1 Tax=Kaistia soli DSM 19436 TaxID=1122133 RepID=A0A1M5K7X6_9HYPH|nr:DUF177 domain-containing protein [Kaistia soli]SHG48791.1 Uncharacterized metal-binding protein YceD, DUF177 family [Kaistia soli DSM 19436]
MDRIPFSRPVDIRRINDSGRTEQITASPEERAAIAASFGILGLDKLEARMVIRPWNRVGLELEGRLIAEAVQACIVTLEPVPERIDQRFSLTFLPPEAQAADPKTVAEAEVIVDVDADDPPDPLIGNTLDLGAIATEQLALALDPYPRAPGADLAAALAEDGNGSTSPFAALSQLKRD